jgi:hypothetical protein
MASVARIPWQNSAFRGFIIGLLHAPYSSAMVSRIAESLASRTEVRLSLISGGASLFHGTGDPAGMDLHGNIDTVRS